MRVAFYGGSFDPFHNGHLAIVRALRTRDLCDEILLAPSAISPGKPESLVLVDIVKGKPHAIIPYFKDFTFP